MCICVAQLCLTLCNPMDCRPPGCSIHGILQTRILEWVAILFSREFSWPRDWTWVSCIAGRFFTVWATWSHLPGFKSQIFHLSSCLLSIHVSLSITQREKSSQGGCQGIILTQQLACCLVHRKNANVYYH